MIIKRRQWPAAPRSQRRQTSGGATYNTTAQSGTAATATPETHNHANLPDLDTLSVANGYLLTDGTRAKAGHADGSDDAAMWDGNAFPDYLDQPLHRSDAVEFSGVSSPGGCNRSVAAVGGGYGIWHDSAGRSHLIVDNLAVREGMAVTSLHIQEIKAAGGVIVVSQGTGEVETVRTYTDGHGRKYHHVYLKDQAGRLQFCAGDLVRCSRWHGAPGEATLLRSYWVRVNYIDAAAGWISVWADEFPGHDEPDPETAGTRTVYDVPQAGDNLVLMGSTAAGRDGFLIISSEDGAPTVTAYSGVVTASLSGRRRLVLGSLEGISGLSGYGLWSDNVALRGSFTLDNGTDVAEAVASYFEVATWVDGVKAAGMQIDAAGIKFEGKNIRFYSGGGVDFYDRNAVLRQTIGTGAGKDGYTRYYYDSGRVQSEFGWDGTSVIRVYDDTPEHRKLWEIGNPARFLNTATYTGVSLTKAAIVDGRPAGYPAELGSPATYYHRPDDASVVYKDTAFTIPIGAGHWWHGAQPFATSDGVVTRELWQTDAEGAVTRYRVTWQRDNNGNHIYVKTERI